MNVWFCRLDVMTEEDAREWKESKYPLRYPWWEPYLYTGTVIFVIWMSFFF